MVRAAQPHHPGHEGGGPRGVALALGSPPHPGNLPVSAGVCCAYSMEEAPGRRTQRMTRLGWLLLSVSWAVLTYWTIWCFVKIWRAPFAPAEDETDQLDRRS